MVDSLKEQMIEIVFNRYRFSGNPYSNEGFEEHDGAVSVCEDIMDALNMSWDEVKAYSIAKIRKDFADRSIKIDASTERYLADL